MTVYDDDEFDSPEEAIAHYRELLKVLGKRKRALEIQKAEYGIAIPAHPLVPYPLCAQGWVIRGLLDRSDERFHPDALETFNPTMLGRPWHSKVVRFAEEHGFAMVGNSDAHALGAIGAGWTEFPGRTAAEVRDAIVKHETVFRGSFHGTSGQVRTFGRQLAKYGRDAHAGVRGRILRDGSGRDLGYPAEHGPLDGARR